MQKKRILFVVGTRPEIVKTASVIQALRGAGDFKVGVCLSGQHISMVTQMLKDFELSLDYDLKIMKKKQTLVSVSRDLMPKLEKVYNDFAPDMVFVQGDTTTAFIASLMAFYLRVDVGHIEAGLRTFDRFFPFPEEMNRSLIGRLATRHYAPTERAKKNLLDEGVPAKCICVTGNTGIDSLKYMAEAEKGAINRKLGRIISGNREVVLVTAHRRENFGKPLKEIIKALKTISQKYPYMDLVYPVHPNPNVEIPVKEALSGISNILLTPPLHYRDLVSLMTRSTFILTDSGGIQEEAPAIGKPVLILRNNTERPETVEAGSAIIVGAEAENIFKYSEELMKKGRLYSKMSERRDVFGDGKASRRILKDLLKQKRTSRR